MTSVLRVPYVGQVGQGADQQGNDCGAACVSMLLELLTKVSFSPDVLYSEAKPGQNVYLSVSDLMGMLSRRSISTEWRYNVSTPDLYWVLSRTMLPCIALIRYGALESIRPNDFKGSHFVVVIGMDLDTVYIHDPLNTPTSGQQVEIPLKLFETAWSTVGDNNPQRGIILPAKQTVALRMVKTNTPNDGLAVRSIPNTAGSKTTLLRYVLDRTPFTIYEERDGWGRVHPTQEEWISLDWVI